MKHVTIIQRRLTHYRVARFEQLKDRLETDGVRLRLLHGAPRDSERSKKDEGTLSWAEPLPTRYFLGERVCWQPFARQVAGEDLVIVTQENAMLANHFALVWRPAERLAFWGHGGNLQGDAVSLKERFKTWSTRQVDWYFAYTRLSVDLVRDAGFPRDRITQLDNAVDLAEIKGHLKQLSTEGKAAVQARLGLSDGPMGLYLGSLYAHKRLDFLLSTAQMVRKDIPDFQLAIVGAGSERALIEDAARQHDWIHYFGPKMGIEKARLLYAADVMLNPGLVGLGILDAFASETPMLTTDCGIHSPEIAYLNESNGIITDDDPQAYANACVEVFNDPERLDTLKSGCRQAAGRFTLPNMVKAFATGIVDALRASPK